MTKSNIPLQLTNPRKTNCFTGTTAGETPRAHPSSSFVVTKVEKAEMRTEMTNDDRNNNNNGMATTARIIHNNNRNENNNEGHTTPSYQSPPTTKIRTIDNTNQFQQQQNYLPSPPRFFTITKPKDPTIISNQLLRAISEQRELSSTTNDYNIPRTTFEQPKPIANHNERMKLPTDKISTTAFPSTNFDGTDKFPFNTQPPSEPHFSDMDHIINDNREEDEFPVTGFKPISDPFFAPQGSGIRSSIDNNASEMKEEETSKVDKTRNVASEITMVNNRGSKSDSMDSTARQGKSSPSFMNSPTEFIHVTRVRNNKNKEEDMRKPGELMMENTSTSKPHSVLPVQHIMLGQDYKDILERHQYGTVMKRDESNEQDRVKMMTFVSIKEDQVDDEDGFGQKSSSISGRGQSNAKKSSEAQVPRRSSSSSSPHRNEVGDKKKNVLISSISSSSSSSSDHYGQNDKPRRKNNNNHEQVVKKVHAHISHCPKLNAPAEVICDVHVNEGHRNPKPQLVSLLHIRFIR